MKIFDSSKSNRFPNTLTLV